MPPIQTRVIYRKSLPAVNQLSPSRQPTDFLFIADQKVIKTNPEVRQWLSQFPFVYKVSGGEPLKDVNALPGHLKKIFHLLGEQSHRRMAVVAIGGGSVGDFAGFIASIFKRGVEFIQIPSTWLATIDSAHGGKNGLNVGPLKNQIGTFWHPSQVMIIDDVINSQPAEQFNDALGELFKMALITNLPWGKKLLSTAHLAPTTLKKYLRPAITEKYHIVKKDPRELKGLRHFLNLGHTFGHVIELEQKIPHGKAVALGLKFALAFSQERGLLKKTQWQELKTSPFYHFVDTLPLKQLSEKQFRRNLAQDKKKDAANFINFVFLKGLGKPLVQKVSIDELIAAGKKHGFIV